MVAFDSPSKGSMSSIHDPSRILLQDKLSVVWRGAEGRGGVGGVGGVTDLLLALVI